MTTIAPLEPAFDTVDDAELALAAARGNQFAFTAIYDRYADRLYDFCSGMLRDRDAAADCVQDVFVIAATKLTQLEDPGRLRAWLYAIARHEALERIRVRRREMPSDTLPEKASGDPDLATLAARRELADLIEEAFGGLSDRDRAVYELAYRHGLDGPELAKALGVSHTNANTMVGRLRTGIERSLGALLVCRSVRANPDACAKLAALVGNWDGVFTPLIRKRALRHIEECTVCDAERRRRVSPAALLGGAPVFVPAPAWLREDTLREAHHAMRPQHKWLVRIGLIAALLLLGIAGATQLTGPLTERVEPAVAPVEPSTSSQRVTTARTSAPYSVTGGVTAQQIPTTTTAVTTAVTTSQPVPSTTSRTSTVTRTSVVNSFEPSRQSTTRTRPQTTTERSPTGTMTATYLPGIPEPTTTTSEPIE
jgi:RNA polymerase sigma factor (sigma-70 family)